MARQNFVGMVLSQGKMNKTVKVRVSRTVYDQAVAKDAIRIKDYLVHDENNLCKEGDIVRIISCDKLSPRKAFSIAQVKKNTGTQFAEYDQLAKDTLVLENNLRNKEFLQRRQERAGQVEYLQSLRFMYEHAYKPSSEQTDENKQKMEAIKTRYNINNWPPSGDALKLQINTLREELSELVEDIEISVPQALDVLMKDEEKVSQILKDLGRDTQERASTRKNILRSYLKKNPSVIEALLI
ncbi:hypothetical protein BABINDRAFT_159386 [Babjeviella inositovora NRRL Y-12698]|uniref:Uncharacterized protein n=1 Tax=Babjeviella inositovora NRRL Y-12698 TaxID=984486 RepID=A0A1E3R0J6_9ASCO|nr:uncharacterized protein BABINDRAFT_159386 [Babjeviella inositovora NRRL Y-12698]ODQ82892.1 hypothetical protein BABINDRAFT_159386 [Babjeviella inositovora NRRL Y-12698]